MTDDHETAERISIEWGDDLVVATLARPEVRNAIDQQLVTELHALCRALEVEPRTLIVTGGPSIFAAGADIRELSRRGAREALDGINSGVFGRLAALPMPVIAAVEGPAIGGGAELAYACDFRIAGRGAVFGQPEIQLGIMAAAGGAFRLRELVGLGLARDMLLAGRQLDAEQALAAGLVSEVVDAGGALDAARATAARIARGAPAAVRLSKLALAAPPQAHPMIDNVVQAVLFETEEKQRRMTAFLERSKTAKASR